MKTSVRTPLGFGGLLLLIYYVALLGGRFSPARIGSLPDINVRNILTPLAILLTLVWLLVEKRRAVGIAPYVFLFFSYTGFLVLSLSWSPSDVAIGRHLSDILHLAAQVGGALLVASRLPPATVVRVWSWSIVAGAVYLVGGVLVFESSGGRLAAFGGGPNTFVRVMLVAAVGSLFAFMNNGRATLTAMLPFFIVGAVLSGSRGGLLAGGLAFAVGLAPTLRRISRQVRSRILTGCVVGGLLVYLSVWDTVRQSFEQRILRLTLEQRYDGFRSEIFGLAVDLWRAAPIRGVGLGGFEALTIWRYPHNILLASAAESGLIGVTLLLLLIGYGIVQSLRDSPSAHGLSCLTAFLVILLASLFSGDYFDSRFAWFFLGLAVIDSRSNTSLRSRALGSSSFAVIRSTSALGRDSATLSPLR